MNPATLALTGTISLRTWASSVYVDMLNHYCPV